MDGTEALDPVSEVVNADWQFDVVRTYVLGVEVLDMRMSDGEFRLLSLLRLRASGGRNNFVSYATLAKDLNTSEKTISRAMSNLQKNGYVTCKSRGFSAPKLKTITSMVERYDDDILKMSRKDLLSSARDEGLLRRLHHLDSAPDHPSRTKMSTPDSKGENGVHTGQICPIIPDKNVPSDRTKMSAEVNKANVNEGELDSAPFGRDATSNSERRFRKIGHTKSGDTYDKDTGEVLDPVVLPTHDPEKFRAGNLADRDAALDMAQASIVQVTARAARKAQEAIELSKARKAQDERSGLAKERKRLREEQRLENKTAGGKFYDWAQIEYDRFFPTIRMTKWMKTEFSQLKTLREACHEDDALVRKAWSYLCEHWDELTKKLKLTDSAPTIGLLLAIRARIVPIVQERQTDRQYAERQSVHKKLGEW
jgi:biotin operon repressor